MKKGMPSTPEAQVGALTQGCGRWAPIEFPVPDRGKAVDADWPQTPASAEDLSVSGEPEHTKSKV